MPAYAMLLSPCPTASPSLGVAAIPDLHTFTNYCAIGASVIAAFDAIIWRVIAAATTTALYADFAAIFGLTPDYSPV